MERLEPRLLLAGAAGLPAQHSLWNPGGYLSPRSAQSPAQIAVAWLQSHAGRLGLLAEDVGSPRITDLYSDSYIGVTHVYLQQQLSGIPIRGASIGVHIRSDGRILSVAGGFVPHIYRIARDTSARLSAGDSLRRARLTPAAPGSAPKLEYVPNGNRLELAWSCALAGSDGAQRYEVSISAASGNVLAAADWAANAAYDVFPYPQLDATTARQIIVDPHDPISSPFGWHDNNGIAGPEFTDTRGNNVFAQEDADANNTGGFRPSGGAQLIFDFALDASQPPPASTSAAVTNLFYWSNLLHDIYYRYGFTEAAGNFQTNNYGHGGNGSDALQADAQDSATTNDATFVTPPDGQAPRMQIGLWNLSAPGRDGDFASQVIIHEYTHGLTSRLTGGPANANALQAVQSAAMAEGWSDFFALALLQTAADHKSAAFPIANYVSGQSPSGVGIRRYPYSFDMATDPLTIDHFGSSGASAGVDRSIEPHDAGEIWASALWDMNWLLIDKYGFEANVRTGYDRDRIRGNTLAMQLVVEALKLQPANPSFASARDAVLQADQLLTGGANQSLIRAAFARRGMGTSFVAGASDSTDVTASFDGGGLFVRGVDPQRSSLTPITSVRLQFSQPVEAASFSLADDVLAFSDAHGTDLLGDITGFDWLDSTTLRINLAHLNSPGEYRLVLGPNVSGIAGGSMDNDFDQMPGESDDDRFVARFSYQPILGPDGGGYSAAAGPAQNLDLIAGQPGVVSLISQSRDLSSWINIGANTFNFFGRIYTGNAAIAASSHGLLSFAGQYTSAANSDLRRYPYAAAIAALWDDWRPDIDVPGFGNSAVLFKLDDTNGDATPDRLIVEWSDVPHTSSPSDPVTFQAILELNTATRPGRIVLNYPDIDTGYVSSASGAGATIGLKDFGPQVGRRLLVSKDAIGHPWLHSGSAITFGTDIVPPSVVGAEFEYRSQQLVIRFSEDIGESLAPDDLTVTNLTTGRAVPEALVAFSYDSATCSATLRPSEVLADGEYQLSVRSSGIQDLAGNALADDFSTGFFVLAGDANRDRRVDISDLAILATNWQQSPRDFSQGDFNYDGVVDVSDLAILAGHWHGAPPIVTNSPFFRPISPNPKDSLILIPNLL